MYHFCTYFDQRYLAQGLALYASLRRHAQPFQLWILCLDQRCYEALSALQLAQVHLVTLDQLETLDPDLRAIKHHRSLIEYYFTCTPCWMLALLREHAAIDRLTYLDADLWFFSDPAPLYAELDERSIGIIAHRFPPHLRDRERFGRYNVGWIICQRDAQALNCLTWWRARCLEWCYDRCEPTRFADQKYLDRWPDLFPGVAVIEHTGANVALWNVANERLHLVADQVWVGDQPLIFFHFHQLKPLRAWLFHAHFAEYAVPPTGLLRTRIYAPYVRALRAAWAMLPPTSQQQPDSLRTRSARFGWRAAVQSIGKLIRGQYMLAVGKRVW